MNTLADLIDNFVIGLIVLPIRLDGDLFRGYKGNFFVLQKYTVVSALWGTIPFGI